MARNSKLKWETAAWSASLDTANLLMQTPYGSATYIELVAPSVVESSTRDLVWVERIVGSVIHGTLGEGVPNPPFGTIKERICKGRRIRTAAAASDVSRPWTVAEAIDDFLWERGPKNVSEGPWDAGGQPTGSPIDPGQTVHPYWSLIDIRVGRALRPGEFLAYTVECDPSLSAANSFVATFGWLRVLMSDA